MTGKSAAGISATTPPDRRAFLRMHEAGIKAFPAKTAGAGNQPLAPRMESGVKVKPGESYTYEFTVPAGNAGSHMYHSHHNSAKQVGLGLLGAFIVEPRRPRRVERVDVDHVMILNDGCDKKGTWAFHCHILPHAESQHGMFGMVTALVVG
ncbi:MAG: multicopper oxidase domain-containing protein [Gemmatimonadaceae bacterium]|nr:multicopper oxidase domain-containing protein [Gemmatimonadaceae bacterium]